LLGRLTRIAVETVLTFYAAHAAQEGGLGAKSGAVTVVQRTSSDLRLNPHLHMIVVDGAWREEDGEVAWEGLGHLWDQRSGGGAGAPGLAHGETPSPERLLRVDADEAEADEEGDPEGTWSHRRCRARRRQPGPSG